MFVKRFFIRLFGSATFTATFNLGFMCWFTVIFGTLKDGSLLINTLASNICFSYSNMFQNGVKALSKLVYCLQINQCTTCYLPKNIFVCLTRPTIFLDFILQKFTKPNFKIFIFFFVTQPQKLVSSGKTK